VDEMDDGEDDDVVKVCCDDVEEFKEDMRYVSDDLEEESDDEFANVCDKLLELGTTRDSISVWPINSIGSPHML
jgi:hypothetical protein